MELKTVISLFDGISCGRLALDRAGIEYDTYYTSEIDKYAIKVAIHNYPDTVELGDINSWKEWSVDWSQVDLILAGSPCQGFSFAGKQLAFDDHRSRLFFVFVDILNHVKTVNPKVKFLLENVVMKQEFQEIITQQVGVEPVLINSALVSAQNRKRLYWANWHFEQPQDKGILLKDIVDEKTGTLTTVQKDNVLILQKGRGNNPGGIRAIDGKTPCMSANSWQDNNHLILTGMANDIKGHDMIRRISEKQYRKLTPVECERLQTVPDGYTAAASDSQRYRMLGNGWTVDVIVHILSSIDTCEQKRTFYFDKYADLSLDDGINIKELK